MFFRDAKYCRVFGLECERVANEHRYGEADKLMAFALPFVDGTAVHADGIAYVQCVVDRAAGANMYPGWEHIEPHQRLIARVEQVIGMDKSARVSVSIAVCRITLCVDV